MTATRFIQTTTTQWPVVKWNSTWRYFRRPRPRIFTTRTTVSTTTLGTYFYLMSIDRKYHLTFLATTTLTTKMSTTSVSSTTSTTQTTWTTSVRQYASSTRKSRLHYTNSSTVLSTTTTTSSSTAPSTVKTTLPLPTPWYPPAGPYDWWQWKWSTTQIIKSASTTPNITHTSTTTTMTTSHLTSTTSSTVPVTNKTAITTAIRENTTPFDWFQWPHLEFTSTDKGRPDYDGEDYSDWPDYFATTKIVPEQTSDSPLFFPAERSRKKFQQMNFFPTNFHDQFINPLLTHSTPLLPKYSTSQVPDRLGRSQSPDARSTGRIQNSACSLTISSFPRDDRYSNPKCCATTGRSRYQEIIRGQYMVQ